MIYILRNKYKLRNKYNKYKLRNKYKLIII